MEEKQNLVNLILEMGHIIRKLDDNNEYLEFWTQDGEYIPMFNIYSKKKMV